MFSRFVFVVTLLFWLSSPVEVESAPLRCAEVFVESTPVGNPVAFPATFHRQHSLTSIAYFLRANGVKDLSLEGLSTNSLAKLKTSLEGRFRFSFSGPSLVNYVRSLDRIDYWQDIVKTEVSQSPSMEHQRRKIRHVFALRKAQGLSNSRESIERQSVFEFNEIGKAVFGRSVRPIEFVEMAETLFVKYERAVEAARLMEKQGYTEQQFVDAIRALVNREKSDQLRSNVVDRLTLDQMNEANRHLQKPMAGQSLLRHSIKIFGGWRQALEAVNAAGAHTSQPAAWTAEVTANVLRALKRELGEKNFNTRSVMKMSMEELSFLEPIIGHPIAGQALLRRFYGGRWHSLMSVAYFLKKQGITDLSFAALSKQSFNDIDVLLQRRFRMSFDGKGLIDQIRFLNREALWEDIAASLSGVNTAPPQIRSQVRYLFNLRTAEGLSNEFAVIKNLSDADFNKLALWVFGREVPVKEFLKIVDSVYGSYDRAVETADFMLKRGLTEGQFTDVIRVMADRFGADELTTKRMHQLSTSQMQFAAPYLTEPLAGGTFLRHTVVVFGSWLKAIDAANIPNRHNNAARDWTSEVTDAVFKSLRESLDENSFNVNEVRNLSPRQLAFLEPILGHSTSGGTLLKKLYSQPWRNLVSVAYFLRGLGVKDLSFDGVSRYDFSQLESQLQKKFSMSFTGSALIEQIRFLQREEAWSDIALVFSARPSTPQQLRRQIRHVFNLREAEGRSNRKEDLEDESFADFNEISLQVFERKMWPQDFVKMAEGSFGTYERSVEAAHTMLKRGFTEEQFIRVTQALAAKMGKEKFKTRFIERLSRNDMKFATFHLPEWMSGTTFVKYAGVVFGSWAELLVAANLAQRSEPQSKPLNIEPDLLPEVALGDKPKPESGTEPGDFVKIEEKGGVKVAPKTDRRATSERSPNVEFPLGRDLTLQRWAPEVTAKVMRALQQEVGNSNFNRRYVMSRTPKDLRFLKPILGRTMSGAELIEQVYGRQWDLTSIAYFLKSQGVESLRFDSLATHNFADFQNLLQQYFGHSFDGFGLIAHIRFLQREDFWQDIAVGSSRQSEAPDQLRRLVRHVFDLRSWEGISNRKEDIEKLTSDDFDEFSQPVFGRQLKPEEFIELAESAFGSFDKAAEAARLMRSEGFTESQFIQALKALGDQYGREELAKIGIASLTVEQMAVTEPLLKRPLSGQTFMDYARIVFGN